MTIPADPLYQHLLLAAENKFWRCVESGETPHLFGVEPPRAKIAAIRTVTSELKALVPEDAREASGHGVRAKRSKSGAISFDIVGGGGTRRAAIQT